jgi:hypothetical protein
VPPRPPAPPARAEPRVITELKRLREDHPELASAIDLQIALLDLQRRIEGRVPLPTSLTESDMRLALAAGRPILRFQDLPLVWSDFRLALRETADLLVRFDVMERADHCRVMALIREGPQLGPTLARWFDTGMAGVAGRGARAGAAREPLDDDLASLDQVLSLAIRPFLSRCAEALLTRLHLGAWQRGYCPLCGNEPEMGVISARGEHALICGRCRGRWPSEAQVCAFCGNDDGSRLTTFGSRGTRYRITACGACRRYLKVYDERGADRPVLVAVDAIATLPLDAAAMQRGYTG